MQGNADQMIYFMAAENIQGLIYKIEATLDFMDEFNVKADDEVKAAMTNQLKRLNDWLT